MAPIAVAETKLIKRGSSQADFIQALFRQSRQKSSDFQRLKRVIRRIWQLEDHLGKLSRAGFDKNSTELNSVLDLIEAWRQRRNDVIAELRQAGRDPAPYIRALMDERAIAPLFDLAPAEDIAV